MSTRTRERLIGLATGVICTLIALALIEIVGAAPSTARIECVPDDDTRERVRQLSLDALDAALKDRIARVYEVWMKDDTGQPERAGNGARQAIRAYISSRKTMLQWTPAICP